MSDTTAKSQNNPDNTNDIVIEVPPNMEASIQAIKEVCETMFGISLEVTGKPAILFNRMAWSMALVSAFYMKVGSYELGLFGSKESSHNLVRAFLGMNPDEEPPSDEVVDLLGEIVNMVSGMVKRSIPGGEQINFGVPLHLIGDDCKTYLPHTIPVIAQPLSGPSFEGDMLLVISDRKTPSHLQVRSQAY